MMRAEYYSSFASTADSQRRFIESRAIRAYWPAGLRERTIPYFAAQAAINRKGWSAYGAGSVGAAYARALLVESRLRAPVSWMLDSSDAEQAIAARALAAGSRAPETLEHVGIGLLAERRMGEASRMLGAALEAGGNRERLTALRALADEAAATPPAAKQ